MFARRLFDVYLTFASSCKRGIMHWSKWRKRHLHLSQFTTVLIL